MVETAVLERLYTRNGIEGSNPSPSADIFYLIKFRMMKDLAQGKINLNELIKLITEKYNPEKIILFGSHARGETDEYSDLDLILIKKTDKGFVERLVDPILLKILPPKTDCFVYTPEEFEQMKENENPFILKALENYKILYEKS